MNAKITIFPVGNGDMTLLEFASGRTILIDTNIREAADNPNDPTFDVASDLRRRLKRDYKGRLYVDVFLLSHPDQDHCSGLDKHFHLGKPEDHTGDKIFIREIWSSPMIFRRASKNHTLCSDAKKFNTEAKRRVSCYRNSRFLFTDGNRIQILGRDEGGKTDDLTDILVEVDDLIKKINGCDDNSISARLLGPLPKSDDEAEEDVLAKNRSSVILQFTLKANGGMCRYLTGGDAEVAIWERLWEKHGYGINDWLEYDILLSPHHCSWHSLSYDSWSEQGESAVVNKSARNALSQARSGANIVASSKPVKANDSDPPCIRAKREYEDILKQVAGEFHCTGEYPTERQPAPLEYEIGYYGLSLKSALVAPSIVISSRAVGGQPLPHG